MRPRPQNPIYASPRTGMGRCAWMLIEVPPLPRVQAVDRFSHYSNVVAVKEVY